MTVKYIKNSKNRPFLFIAILLIVFSGHIHGQSNKIVFIGVQPAITVEPFYEKGELDVNIFPFMIETPIGLRSTLKLTPLINYHSGGSKNGISDIGLFAILPFYFQKRADSTSRPFGFYLGPVVGFGRNKINDHYTTTLAVEPGYMFQAEKKFTISIGLQLGGSFFSYDSEPNKWVFHWGPKISLGLWLGGS